MKLSDIIGAVPDRVSSDFEDREITSIHHRSQEVRPGGLFVAIAGHVADGHAYVEDAIRRGAAAVVVEHPLRQTGNMVRVADSRKALAQIACRFYGHPSEHLTLIGVTGTNGKTTVSYLVEGILEAAGRQTGVIGTVNYRYGGKAFRNPVTTPESIDLQRILTEMRQNAVSHVVMEVSSHALDLHRVDGCWLDVGVFTNLSQDHLDYHRDMQHYWQSKQRMFTDNLGKGPKATRAVAVVNRNDGRGRELFDKLTTRAVSVGNEPVNDVYAAQASYDLSGIRASVVAPVGRIELTSQLVGRHNLENILCAIGVGVALGLSAGDIRTGIQAVDCIPGRLEPVPNETGRFVYVDYAHTPDALGNVLGCLGALAVGRLIAVFGCGGNRDRDKRPKMGEIAARQCALVVVTSDNPRNEEPSAIIADILPGVLKARSRRYTAAELQSGFAEEGYTVEVDRRAAIRLAIRASRPGDTIVIAGKGHENYQIIGQQTLDFDDCVVAGEVLAECRRSEKVRN